MDSISSQLNMLSLSLDPARVLAIGRRQKLPLRDVDAGYLVHGALGELFGDRRPNVFQVMSEQGPRWRVLAYSFATASELRDHAACFADPAVYAAMDWDSFAGKTMPQVWPEGHTLGFEVRVCPVIRKSSSGEKHRAGAEVDAFLARCWSVGRDTRVDREAVYREWFSENLLRIGGATPERVRLIRMQRHRLVRRTQGNERKAHAIERPDATLAGELKITDGMAFMRLLERGIGRHRAFGFGMLLLKPASSC
jgi:CRISPR system Cascade subunit CasE